MYVERGDRCAWRVFERAWRSLVMLRRGACRFVVGAVQDVSLESVLGLGGS